jgi:hypothetical protein
MQPQPGGEHNWHVWDCTGALQVLQTREFIAWLAENPGEWYTINFANNSSANINPTHPLWQVMVEIAKTYTVEVYQLTLSGGYVPWTGEANSLHHFDAIKIAVKRLP